VFEPPIGLSISFDCSISYVLYNCVGQFIHHLLFCNYVFRDFVKIMHITMMAIGAVWIGVEANDFDI
jgi:hypothetical protein